MGTLPVVSISRDLLRVITILEATSDVFMFDIRESFGGESGSAVISIYVITSAAAATQEPDEIGTVGETAAGSELISSLASGAAP